MVVVVGEVEDGFFSPFSVQPTTEQNVSAIIVYTLLLSDFGPDGKTQRTDVRMKPECRFSVGRIRCRSEFLKRGQGERKNKHFILSKSGSPLFMNNNLFHVTRHGLTPISPSPTVPSGKWRKVLKVIDQVFGEVQNLKTKETILVGCKRVRIHFICKRNTLK